MSATAFLDTLRSAYEARQVDLKETYEKALKAAVEAAQAEMREALARVLRAEVLEHFDWQLVYRESIGNVAQPVARATWKLIPRDLPEYAGEVALAVRLGGRWVNGHAQGEVLEVALWGNESWQHAAVVRLRAEQSAGEQLALLAGLVVPQLDYLRKCEVESEQRRFRNEENERQRQLRWEAEGAAGERRNGAAARARAQIEAQAARARAELEAERVAFVAANAWLEGQTITVWRVSWTSGYDAEAGEWEHQEVYTIAAEPSEGCFLRILEGTLRTVRLVTPGGYLAQREDWRGLADVPGGLGLTAEREFGRHLYVAAEYEDLRGADRVEFEDWIQLPAVEHPAGILREWLGLPAEVEA